MNINIFIKSFAKTYVPALLFLMVVYMVTQMIPAAIKPNTTLHPPPVKSNASIEPGTTPPPITNRSPAPPPSKSVQKKLVKPPEPQRYKYFIRFTSGGSMTANDVRVDGNRVTLIVDKGYEVSMSKVDIASIQRQKK